jgi:hypothetical protein
LPFKLHAFQDARSLSEEGRYASRAISRNGRVHRGMRNVWVLENNWYTLDLSTPYFSGKTCWDTRTLGGWGSFDVVDGNEALGSRTSPK